MYLCLFQDMVPIGSLSVHDQEVAIIEDLLYCMEVKILYVAHQLVGGQSYWYCAVYSVFALSIDQFSILFSSEVFYHVYMQAIFLSD